MINSLIKKINMRNTFGIKTISFLTSILIYSFTLCLNVNYEINAQVKLSDTTQFETTHSLKTKPKKIKKRRAVYKLEAQSVCDVLNLNTTQCDSLAEAYRIARKNRKLELTKYSNKNGENYKKIVQGKVRANLKSVLKRFLEEEQVNKAMTALGSFNPQWDGYVYLITNFNLEKEKMKSALNQVYFYIVNYEEFKNSKGRKKKKAILKNKLDEKLKTIFNEEQFAYWTEQTNKNK